MRDTEMQKDTEMHMQFYICESKIIWANFVLNFVS